MADLEKTVSIIFQGDDRISSTVRNLNKSFSNFESVALSVASPLANIAESVIATDAALAALAVGGMALAIRESGKFGDAFNEIATLIDVPRENLDDFRRDIIEYAKASTSSIDDINAAVYTAISAGTDYARSLEVLSISEKLATAGKADLEATVRLLASTLNAYGEGVDQATRYSDVFFRTVKDGQTTLPELAESLSQVTGIAASAGIPIETLMAALAALTATGAPTSQAITQIRGAIAAIVKPSQQASELASQLGIDFSVAALQGKGFEVLLKEVYAATGGNVDQMAQLFGRVEGLNAALVLGADRSGKFAGALLDMRNATGATEEAFSRMAENISQINQTLANDIRAILIALGDDMIGGYSNVAKGIQDVLQNLETEINAGTFDPIFAAFDDFASQLTIFLREVSEALPGALENLDYSGLIDSLEILGRAVANLFDGVDLTDAKGLASALQEIIDAGEALMRVTAGMAQAFKPYLETLRESVQEVNKWDEDTQAAFGRLLVAAEGIVRFGLLAGSLMATLSELGVSVGAVFDTVTGVFDALYGALLTFRWSMIEVLLRLQQGVVTLLAEISSALSGIPGFDFVTEKLNAASAALAKWADEARALEWENLGRSLEGLKRAAGGISDVFDDGTNSAKGLADAVNDIPDSKSIDVAVNDAVAVAAMNEIRDHIDDLVIENPEIEILPILSPDTGISQEMLDIMENAQRQADQNQPTIKPKVDKGEAEKELDKLKIGADLIKESLKFQAEVDIAMAQEATKRLEAGFASVSVSIQSTGETLVGLFSQLGDVEGIANKWRIQEAIDQEIALRQQAFDLQSRLVASTVELNKAQAERLESGDAFFTISTEGLTPALEMLLIEIIEKIQMQVIASGDQALIDLTSFTGI